MQSWSRLASSSPLRLPALIRLWLQPQHHCIRFRRGHNCQWRHGRLLRGNQDICKWTALSAIFSWSNSKPARMVFSLANQYKLGVHVAGVRHK